MKAETRVSQLKELAKKVGLQIRDDPSVPLEGLWEDVKITNRDIEQAKRQVSRNR